MQQKEASDTLHAFDSSRASIAALPLAMRTRAIYEGAPGANRGNTVFFRQPG
jgi:hypothetical protein